MPKNRIAILLSGILSLGLLIAGTAVAIAFLATGIALASDRYALRHPRSEHCRRNYVRVTKTVRIRGRLTRQVWCVHHVSKPAAPKEASAGSLEWLLAHTSVAHVSEVLSREVASFVANSNKEKASQPGEQKSWTLSGPRCKTGTEYGAGFIHCEEEAELHITHLETRWRLVPCSSESTYCPEAYTEEVADPSQRYLMELFVSGNDSLHCGDYSTFVFGGDEWQPLQSSRPRCNVAV